MLEFASLPERFADLQGKLPVGYTCSERILDPVMIIERGKGHVLARLAGVKVVRGERAILRAPTSAHAWVVDGTVVRPLPHDAPRVFEQMLNGANPEALPYELAVQLIRSRENPIEIYPEQNFLASGNSVAAEHQGEIDIPGLHAELYPYQAKGIQWMLETMSHAGGLILADEMGLGKTLQVIGLLLLDRPSEESPALVICPTSLIANWTREFQRFAPDISLLLHRGPARTGIYRGLQKANVVITTYDTMANDLSIFCALKWSWVICDEAQAIKNPDSNRRQSVVQIPRLKSVAMTGTPVENSLLDLWSLADFAIPGLLGSRAEFETAYPDSVEAAQSLGAITDPIILKRHIADVACDLPERIDIDVPLELDATLVEHYREVHSTTIENYPVAGYLVATLQLQLVCAHPWLRPVEGEDADGEDAVLKRDASIPLMTPKMDRAVALLREAFHGNKKVLVFSIFNRVGDLLREAGHDLPKAYWGAINGSTPQDDRQPIIDEFSAYVGPGCLVLNPKAAGSGLNITAATVVIHFTPVWNPAIEDQASARSHRRGQIRPVTVYRLFYEDTVERVMIDRSLWKRELGNEIVPLSSRDSEDIDRALQILPRLPS